MKIIKIKLKNKIFLPKACFLFGFCFCLVSLFCSMTFAAPLKWRIINHEDKQIADFLGGDECLECKIPDGWIILEEERESLEGKIEKKKDELLEDYEEVEYDGGAECSSIKSEFCCTENHSGSAGDCSDLAINKREKKCKFLAKDKIIGVGDGKWELIGDNEENEEEDEWGWVCPEGYDWVGEEEALEDESMDLITSEDLLGKTVREVAIIYKISEVDFEKALEESFAISVSQTDIFKDLTEEFDINPREVKILANSISEKERDYDKLSNTPKSDFVDQEKVVNIKESHFDKWMKPIFKGMFVLGIALFLVVTWIFLRKKKRIEK